MQKHYAQNAEIYVSLQNAAKCRRVMLKMQRSQFGN